MVSQESTRSALGLTMGSTRLWLPSLRSVDSHRGGRSIVLLGQDRSGRSSGLKALYFFHGSLSIGMSPSVIRNAVDYTNSQPERGLLMYVQEDSAAIECQRKTDGSSLTDSTSQTI